MVIGSVSDMASSKKFRDIDRTGKATLLIDDLASTTPWRPRGIEVRGRALAVASGGTEVGHRLKVPFEMDDAYLRIEPQRIVSWGLESDERRPTARTV